MAKKTITNSAPPAPKAAPPPPPAAKSTPVRNSAIPKTPAPASRARDVTHEMIARRAYEISISGSGGSEFDNWIRAEKELKGL